MRLDDQVFQSRVIGQGDRDRGRFSEFEALAIKDVADGSEMRSSVVEGLGDCRLEITSAMLIE
jgi:hypothetical protein